jgi:hypothetical protein
MSAEAQPSRPERPRPASMDPAVIAARVLPLRRALLHELRWRAPDVSWRRIAVAVAVVVVAHLVLVLLVRDAMRPKPFVEDRRDVIQVSLIELPPLPEPAALVHELPPLSVSAPPTGSARNAPAPARRDRGQRQVEAPAAASGDAEGIVATPAPSLYNPDGSLRIAPAAPEPEARDPMTRGKLAAEELAQRGHNIVRCKRTRFAGAYTPDESIGDRAARKYGAYVGLYNPATAQKAAKRAADARGDCDWED